MKSRALLLVALSLAMFFLATGISGCNNEKVKHPEDNVPKSAEATKPLSVGSHVPKLTLTAIDGKPFDLNKAFANKASVLIFFRGGW